MLTRFTDSISKYYEEEFSFILHKIQRPLWLGVFLLLGQFFYHVELAFSNEVSDQFSGKDILSSYIIDNSIFLEKIDSVNFLYASTTVNGLMVVALLNNYIYFSFKTLSYTSKLSEYYIGILGALYQHGMFIPFLFFSFDAMSEQPGLALPNIICTILLGIIIAFHDQDFSFIASDSLAKRLDSRDLLVQIGLEVLTCLFLKYLDNPKFMLIGSLCLSLFKLIKSFALKSYENIFIRKLNSMLQLLHLIIIVVLFIGIFFDQKVLSISLMTLSFGALSICVAISIQQWQNDLRSWSTDSISYLEKPESLDFFLRLLVKNIKLDFGSYIYSNQSIHLDAITSEHIQSCEEFPNCFCNTQGSDDLAFMESMRQGRTLRFQFLVKYVRSMYLRYITDSMRRKRDINVGVCLSYLSFLVEVYQNKVLSFSEIIKIKRIVQLSARENEQLFEVYLKATHAFEKKELVISMAQKKQKKFEEEELKKFREEEDINFQNGSMSEKVNVTDYFIGITFDEQLNEAEKNYFNILQEKSNFLVLLFNDHIDLTALRLQGNIVNRLRDSLNFELASLYKVNSQNQKLLFFAEGFSTYFGFGMKRRNMFVEAKQTSIFLSRTDVSIFNKDTCVIFVTLINQIGTIRRVQNKFEQMFEFPSSKIINGSINIILPSCMRKEHEIVLQEYLINPDNSRHNSFNLLVAQNDKGWAVPTSLKFRPQNISLDDCGLTAFLQKPSTNFNYIQVSAKYFQVQCISQGLFESCFNNYFSQQEVHKLHLNRVIPILNYLEDQHNNKDHDSVFNEVISTLAFLPKLDIYKRQQRKFHLLDKIEGTKIPDLIQSFTIEFYDVYQVKFKYYFNEFRHFQFGILEIQSFKKINNYMQLKEQLVNFKNQLKATLNLIIDQKSDIEIIDQLIELQDLQTRLLDGHPKMQYHAEETSQSSYSEENEDKFSMDNNPIPLPAQRDPLTYKDIKEEPTAFNPDAEVSKTSQMIMLNNQANTSMAYTGFAGKSHIADLGESHILQGSTFNNPNKFNEISEVVEPLQGFREIADVRDDRFIGPNDNILIDDSNQNEILFSSQTFQIPMISPTSLQAGMISPHPTEQQQLLTGMISPHQSDNWSVQQNIQDKSQLHHNSLNTQNQTIISRNKGFTIDQIPYDNFHSLLNMQSHGSIGKQISFPSINKNKVQLSSKGTGVGLSEISLDKKRSIEQITSISNIFSEYYEMRFREDPITDVTSTKIGRQFQQQFLPLNSSTNSNKGNENQPVPLNSSSNTAKNDGGSKSTNYLGDREPSGVQKGDNLISLPSNTYLNQLLKDRIKQAKLHIEQTISISTNTQKQLSSQFQQSHNLKLDRNDSHNIGKHRTGFKRERTGEQRKGKVRIEKIKHYYLKAEDATSEQFSDSDDRDAEMQKEQEKQRSKILGTSSVHTNQSSNQEQKRVIHRLVNSRKKNISLVVLMLFGILALSAFVILVLVQLFQTRTTLDTALTNFSYLPWAYQQRFDYSKIFSDFMLKVVIKSGELTALLPVSTHLAATQTRMGKFVVDFYSNTYNFFFTNLESTDYFSYALDTPLGFVITHDVNSIPYPLLNITSQKIYQNISMQYFLIRIAALFWRATYLPDLATQIIIQDNFSVLMNTVNSLKIVQMASVVDSIGQIKSQSLFIMLVVIATVVVLGYVTIPLNYHIQKKNEELLKLFATIPSEAINDMLQPIQIAVNQHRAGKTKILSVPTQKKRKTISSTSSLPTIKSQHFFFVSLGIMCMVIQPIISYVFIDNFYTEAYMLTELTRKFELQQFLFFVNIPFLTHRLQKTENLYYMKAFCSSVEAITYASILHRLVPSFELYNPAYYASRITTLSSQRQDMLTSLGNLIMESHKTSRYQDNLYQDFFYEVLEGNTCKALEAHAEYIPSNLGYSISDCYTVRKGLMQKGLQISLKDYFEIMVYMTPYFDITDQTLFAAGFQSQFDLKDIDVYYDLLTDTIQILKDFILTRIMSYIDYINYVYIALLFYQFSMMAAIFYFGFFKFYRAIEADMFATRQLLNIIQIEYVVENPYIFSYLIKQE